MHTIYSHLKRSASDFLKDEGGPTAVEYAIMMSLVIVVCVATLTTLGTNSKKTFSYVGKQVKVKNSKRK